MKKIFTRPLWQPAVAFCFLLLIFCPDSYGIAVRVRNTKPAGNPTLSSLAFSLSLVKLSPAFSPNDTSYTALLGYQQASIRIIAEAAKNTTITVDGVAIVPGKESQTLQIAPGYNTITIKVTATNGLSTTYTVIANRLPQNAANLASLMLSEGKLQPGFKENTITYSATEPNNVTSIRVIATTIDSLATFYVGTRPTDPPDKPLKVGNNIIYVTVRSEDGYTVKVYTLNITRLGSANTGLSSLNTDPSFPVTLTSTSATEDDYSDTVLTTTKSLQIIPVVSDPDAAVTVNGTIVVSGAESAAIPLAVGDNVINVVVNSSDTAHTKTYKLTILRPSGNATLADLHLTGGGILSPAFSSANTAYTTSVDPSTTSIMVTPKTSVSASAITVNGTPVADDAASGNIALKASGTTVINIVVTAQNGVTTKTYTVTVSKTGSNDAGLSKITLHPTEPLTLVSKTGDENNYTATVPAGTASMQLKAVPNSPGSVIKVDGTVVASNTLSPPVTLSVGTTTITVLVTAPDGSTTKTYSIAVTRPADAPAPLAESRAATGTAATNDAVDNVVVHQAVSANGDGINDYLQIDGILSHPENTLMIINRSGEKVFEASGYSNGGKVFDGHSSITGTKQPAGTYFYMLKYTVNKLSKQKSGYFTLKY